MLLDQPRKGELESWHYSKMPVFPMPDEDSRDSYKLVFMGDRLVSCLPPFCKLSYHFPDCGDFANLLTISRNKAECSEMLVVHIDDSTILDKPLDVFYLSGDKSSVSIRVQFIIGRGSKLKVFEYFYSMTNAHGHAIINCVSFFKLLENAIVEHYLFQMLGKRSDCFYASYIECSAHSFYQGLYLNSGGLTVRNEVHVFLCGLQARAETRGIASLSGKQHYDAYLPVHHVHPSAYSRQHFRNVLRDDAQSVFYGKIIVPRGSFGNESHQLNKNMLLSNRAKAYSRPELEILNQDVICTHGATIGQVDLDAAYYLCSRGIGYEEALSILVRAFTIELLDEGSPDDYVRRFFGVLMGEGL